MSLKGYRLRVFSLLLFITFGCVGVHGQLPANPFSSNPSFGLISKKTVTLKSKLPPIFNASGKTVGIDAKDSMISIAVEKQLTQSDSSIRVGGTNPDLMIECVVSQTNAVKQVTTTDSNGSSTHWVGDLAVMVRITEPRSRLVVKSDVVSATVNEPISSTKNATGAGKIFGMKTPASGPTTTNYKSNFATTDQAENFLINEVAKKIAGYLVTTEQSIVVPLAVGGALNAPNKLADNGLWPRYKEALEVLTPYPDAKNEAYRTYNIGVANEALAYQALDNAAAIKYLQQASTDYGRAMDAKPEEKGFIEAQSRIKAALEYYSEIGQTHPMGSSAGLSTSLVPTPSPGAMTNQDVIDMVQAHLDEANIMDTIKNASDVNFDVSPKGQIALGKSGVNSRIILAMSQRARGEAVPGRHK
jgi:hypothetical protein